MMNEKLYEAIGNIHDDNIESAHTPQMKRASIWMKWGTMAACFCLLLAGGTVFTHNGGNVDVPHPETVQISNPMLGVSSVDEMEQYLDFDVPVLNKQIKNCVVLVEEQYPVMGCVNYEDGSKFRIKYGSEDISGIHGGTLVETKVIDGISVNFYQQSKTSYAIWEQNGFSFSYTYSDDGMTEIKSLIRQFR